MGGGWRIEKGGSIASLSTFDMSLQAGRQGRLHGGRGGGGGVMILPHPRGDSQTSWREGETLCVCRLRFGSKVVK